MDHPAEHETGALQLRRQTWVMAAMWTLFVAASAAWSLWDRLHDTEALSRLQARTALDMDIAYRHWNAMHGGVYAPVTAETVPNPDLKNEPERDITTPSGKRLTLVNHAHMLREAHEFLREGQGVQTHLTSLQPIRLLNGPDAFETKALQAFERGQAEFSAIEQLGGQECMRLMRPLITENACLQCHAKQGHREGDIGGGHGIAVPMAPLQAMQRRALLIVALAHILGWVAGLGLGAFSRHRVLRAVAAQDRAEELLHQSEQKYRALVVGTNDVVYSVAADGKVDFIGPQIARYGFAESDILAQDLLEHVHPEDKAIVGAAFKDRIQNGKEAPTEFRAVAKDGRIFCCLDNGKVRRDKTGKIVGVTGALVDITERKGAEAALQESEERYRELIFNQSEGLGIVDPEERFTFANPAGAEIFGVPPGSLVGRTLKEFMTPKQYALVVEETKKRRAGKKSIYELRIVRPDGETRILQLSAVPRTDKAGRFIESFGLFHDITARKRAEEALRASERNTAEALEFNKKILNAPSIGILTYEASGQCVSANEAAAKVVGTNVAGLLAQNFHLIQSWKEYGMYEAALAALRTDTEQHLEKPLTTTFGKRLWASLRFSSFQSKGEKHLLVFLHDITERKRAEEALKESEEKYRTLYESSRDAIMTVAPPDWRFTSGNPATVAMFRAKDEAEFTSKRPWELSPQRQPEGRPSSEKAREMIEKAVREGTHFFEWTHKRLNGEEFQASVLLTRFQRKGQTIVQATVRDITQQKQAEEALKASEAQLKEAQRLAQVGSWSLEVETGTLTWSEEMYRIHGRDPKLPAPSLQELLIGCAPESCLRLERTIKESLETGKPHQIELELVRPDGNHRWITSRGEAVRDHTGCVVRLHGTAQDITERKRAEEVLRESEERERRILHTAMDGFWIADHEGHIRDVNDAYCRISGYSRTELLSLRISDLEADEPTPADVAQHMAQIVREGSERFETRHRAKDRRVIHVEVAVGSLDIEHGLVFAFLRDITARKRAEEALREGEQRERLRAKELQAVLEAVPSAVLIADSPDCHHIVGNRAAYEMLRIPHGSELSLTAPAGERPTHLKVVRDGQEIPKEDLPVRQAVRSGVVREFECSIAFDDGTIRHVLCNAAPMLDEQGRPRGAVSALLDITERRHAEDSLRRMNRAYCALSACGRAVAQAGDETALLKEVVRIVQHDCGYRMVWIGLVCHDEGKTVRPVAHAGIEAGYMEALQVTWADTERGRGPTGTSIRTGQAAVVRDVLTDPSFSPWREAAVQSGYASVLAVPLLHYGQALGALNLYSPAKDSFSEEEIRLLSEVAQDVAHGLATLRAQAARMQAQESLRQSEEKARQKAEELGILMDLAPAAILVGHDPQCHRITGNQVANRFLGAREGDNVSPTAAPGEQGPGRRFFQNGREIGPEERPLQRAAAQGLEVRDVELDMLLPSGRSITVFGQASPLFDGKGQVRGSIGVFMDVTEQKLAEQEMRGLREQLYHAGRVMMMGELTTAIAHQLNQPLAAIMSNAQAAQRLLAADRLGAAELREILSDIVAQDKRGSEVIQHIRKVLRKGKLDTEPLDLNGLVSEAVELFRSALVLRNAVVTLNLAPALPLVSVDRVQLQQVILNVLVNALESMEMTPINERRLNVRTTQPDGDTVQVAIEDSGTGILADRLGKVFEPFFTTKLQGLGMGLSISRSIICSHGGRIWATNNAGRGSTIQFALPIHESTQPGAAGRA